MTPEERKLKTELYLKEKNIPYIDHLPPIESEADISIRETDEVGRRIICLFCLAGTAFNEGDNSFIEYLKKYEFWQFLSKEEKLYLENPTYETKIQINATWRLEALYLLLWATNIVPELPYPTKEASVNEFINLMPRHNQSPVNFISSLKLRPASELLDASDLIYRLHWAIRQHGAKLLLNASIIQERHHAINWLTNYGGEPWDSVSTDT